MNYLLWACALGGLSAASLPLGSWVGLRFRFSRGQTSLLAAFGAGALLAALSVELVAPTAIALAEGPDGIRPFLALLLGCVLGGLSYVGLDRLLSREGGFLRRPSTLLRYYQEQSADKQAEMLTTLAKIPLFRSLPQEAFRDLLEILSPVRFETGETLIEQGAPVTAAHFLIDGQIEARVNDQALEGSDPSERVVALPSMVLGIDSPGTCVALTPILALRAPRKGIEQLRQRFPQFDQACRDLAAQRIGLLSRVAALQEERVRTWLDDARERLSTKMDLLPPPRLAKIREEHHGAPLAIWLGILLDGIPESVTIGAGMVSLLAAQGAAGDEVTFLGVVPFTLIAGLFLSNFPEALSSSATMLDQGSKPRRIFVMWFSLMIITAVGAGAGYLIAESLAETWMVMFEGLAAGAMLTMIAAAMIPEAVLMGSGNSVGLATLAGFVGAVSFKLLE